MFNLVRFKTSLEATAAVAGLQAFLVTPSGAFTRKAVPAVILRREPLRGDPVLYFSDGALSAANQARIYLPPTSERVPRGAVPAKHSPVRFSRRVLPPGSRPVRAP
jgi:hypothetical protein